MKVVLTHPFCWPYVRRGSERNMDIVARYLAGRGHEVVTVSSHPQKYAVENYEGGTRLLSRPWRVPAMGMLHVEETHTFFLPALQRLRALAPDVVHSFFFMDALAATCARRSRRYPIVFQMNGIALPGISCRRFPPEAWLWRKALRRVNARIACSRFIGELLDHYYGLSCHVLCPPVNIEDFPFGTGPADGRPVILSVADFTVPRKGVRVLIRAFRRLKSKVPDAVLKLSGNMPAWLQTEVLRDLPESIGRDIHVLGLGKPGDVSRHYREAALMCLPAMWEPSGGSVLESLASGTPVVAPGHGGLPEYLTDETGVLFDPITAGQETENDAGLADALVQGLELARRPGTRERCRAHVEQYATHSIGPKLERIYAAA